MFDSRKAVGFELNMGRVTDILVSITVLVLFSPILLIVALAVFLESPGNPFYRGWRVGKDGVCFRMWKFRTMIRNASKLGSSITGRNDPRITRIGRILRQTKLDEFPQFVNVLRGDMTLVGPRPESPEIVEFYSPMQRTVLAVTPGVTGQVQLDSREESENLPEGLPTHEYYINYLMHSKLQRDLEYLQRRTPRSDTLIVFQTAGYVLRTCIRR
jgi:lipopolysaccharide/colanic/teichoic acid biosynthesis glycosyltransferase